MSYTRMGTHPLGETQKLYKSLFFHYVSVVVPTELFRMKRPFELRTDAYYSNGAYGRSWGVRQVIEFSIDTESGEETVVFKGIAGTCRRKTGHCTLAEFSQWVRHEVILNENSWQRCHALPEQ